MIIPPVSIPGRSATIINKTIVYSDTVLSLKDIGNNLKVSSISNISEDELEECLQIIFKYNPNIVFNTIQYSRTNKKIYFYTNKEITTKVYEESKFRKYKPITSKTEILEEIKNVLSAPKNKNSDCISLYDVANVLRQFHYKYDSIIKKHKKNIEEKIGNSSIVINDFDYKNKMLNIYFDKYSLGNLKEICFSKENGDLYVAKSKSCWTEEFFDDCCLEISDLYDELLEYSDYKNYRKSKHNLKAVNSNFYVDIDNYGVTIFVKLPKKSTMNEFKLAAHSYENDYSFEKCNSSIIREAIIGKEDEIFKRIFVEISDCPEWSQTKLYEIRQNQLIKDEEIKQTETKKQKRLELIKKFFPFLKK